MLSHASLVNAKDKQQKETVFTKSHYEKLRKVYSIWVCTEVPKYYQNTIMAYSMAERSYFGNAPAEPENYDLLSVVMIGLGDSKVW
ncbi:hypothetical protein IJT17_01790 [bacterium]|nr:hypothetical protein [bacterium]